MLQQDKKFVLGKDSKKKENEFENEVNKKVKL